MCVRNLAAELFQGAFTWRFAAILYADYMYI